MHVHATRASRTARGEGNANFGSRRRDFRVIVLRERERVPRRIAVSVHVTNLATETRNTKYIPCIRASLFSYRVSRVGVRREDGEGDGKARLFYISFYNIRIVCSALRASREPPGRRRAHPRISARRRESS